MSISSTYEIDNSAALAKRFATLATGYIDNPPAAMSSNAKVPLENLFRILEMFRYNAFADESRRGVLAIGEINQRHTPRVQSEAWQLGIVKALNAGLTAAFSTESKDVAITEIQDGLRQLAKSGALLPSEQANKVRTFLATFETTLV